MALSLGSRTTKRSFVTVSQCMLTRGGAIASCSSSSADLLRTPSERRPTARPITAWRERSTWAQSPLFQLSAADQTRWGARRSLQTENDFHNVADETLDSIQDALDDLFDKQTLIEYEVSLSSGVLSLKLPPHGTWVINKQTPNMQLWWSSPLSGPQRFEYNDAEKLWCSTKSGLFLGQSLSQEIHGIFPELDPLELSV